MKEAGLASPSRVGVTRRAVLRPGSGGPEEPDEVAVEEPLEIRVAGEALATTMRTPGHDRQLALGFLYAEGVIGALSDVGSIAPCGRPGEAGYGNVVDVTQGPGVSLDVERLGLSRRGTLITSACGVCGRRTIDDLLERCAPIDDGVRLSAGVIAAAVLSLRALQPGFDRTGGTHAAGVFDERGAPLAVFEDVGRHNAVDKAVGQLLLEGRLPARRSLLVVSGRASFEIVFKAVVARVPVVVSVSAASSLAIDLAARSGLTLAAFVRPGRMNVYAGFERIAPGLSKVSARPRPAAYTRRPT